jgi:hypothetical protein
VEELSEQVDWCVAELTRQCSGLMVRTRVGSELSLTADLSREQSR